MPTRYTPVLALLLLGSSGSTPLAPTLRTSPSNVYRLTDPGREATESCTFMLVLPEAEVPAEAQIVTLAGGRELESRVLTAEGLKGVTINAGTRSVIRLQVRRPESDSFDRVRGTIQMTSGMVAPFDVPVSRYTLKTRLIFPFRGRGLISSGGVNDGGHKNSSGQFAIDALALTEDYAPMICAEDRNECSAGFGRREIVAPADGVVVSVWNDIPDNPSWESVDPTIFTRPDGRVIDTGNSVVLDHGNGEFSVIAHMKQGSILVTVGQPVRQGGVIGLLGNSRRIIWSACSLPAAERTGYQPGRRTAADIRGRTLAVGPWRLFQREVTDRARALPGDLSRAGHPRRNLLDSSAP